MKYTYFAPLLVFSLSCSTLKKAQLASSDNPVPRNEETLAEAKELYQIHCVQCHGVSGKGDGPNANQDTASIAGLRDKKDGVFAYYILYGKEKGMPAFKETLSEDDAFKLVHFLRNMK